MGSRLSVRVPPGNPARENMAVTGLPCRFRVRSLSDGGQVAPRGGRHTPSSGLAFGEPVGGLREAIHRPRRHCERSEAIHSSFTRRDGLLRGACHRARIRATRWLAMTTKHTFASSPREAPEALFSSAAQRGRGERRVPVAPAASRALCIGRTHTSKRVHRNHPTFPHAMVLTVSFVLSPVTGLFCHRRPRICFV